MIKVHAALRFLHSPGINYFIVDAAIWCKLRPHM